MSTEYYKTSESVEEYIRLAKDVDSAQLIERFKRYLHTNSTILELGSGPGTDWGILNEDFDVVGQIIRRNFYST